MKATVRIRSRKEAAGARRRASDRLKLSLADASHKQEATGEEGDDELTPQPGKKRTKVSAPPAASPSLVAPRTPEIHRSSQENSYTDSQRRKHALAKSPVRHHGSTTKLSVDMSSDDFSFLFPLPEHPCNSLAAAQGTISTPVLASQRGIECLKPPSSACADVEPIHHHSSHESDTEMHSSTLTFVDAPAPPSIPSRALRKPGRARIAAQKKKKKHHFRLSAPKTPRQGIAPATASSAMEESSDDELGFLRQQLALVDFGAEASSAPGARQCAGLLPLELDDRTFEDRKKRRVERSSGRGADAYEATIRMNIL